jgi:hypothetical protein
MSNRKRPTLRRAACATVMLTGATLGATTVPASASLTGPGVDPGQNITVFHNLDFVAVSGYGPAGTVITVDVIRAGVRIGTVTAPTVDTPEGAGLEINHGPEGTPQPGDCWAGVTPNILPGDRIVVTEGADTDEVTVDDIRFTGAPVAESTTGDVLVRGIAQRADGTAIPLAALDSGEFRDDTGQLRLAPNRIEATPGVTNGFTMRYSAPYSFERNVANLTDAQIKAALLSQNGHATGFGHVDPLPLETMIVDGIADTPGPAAGCETLAPADPGTVVPDPGTVVTDTVAPTVTGRSPANGARNVARTANVTATFSENVKGVDASTIRVTNSRGGVVAAAVAYNDATRTATVDPNANLIANTDYRVTLTSGVTDLANNALATTSWRFRTGR